MRLSMFAGMRGLATTIAALAALAIVPAASRAATTTFGSSLAVAPTADTANGLDYRGTDIPTIIANRGVVVHVNHDGADTALWQQIGAPAAGQVVGVKLEGCAQPAAGGPPALTQIHFQDLTPLPDGSVRVNVTTQAFDIPVCGSGGAGPSTITTYEPTNFCINAGDYVAFNDEGGFDPLAYPSGVSYQVLGAVPGAGTYSFIRNNGTNNGAVFSPTDTTYHDGFAANKGRELMLQATLATGADATPLCPGGTRGVKPPAPVAGAPGGPPAVAVPRQTDGVNHSRWVGLAVYCAQPAQPCSGTVTVVLARSGRARAATLGSGVLSAPPHKTVHVRVRLTSAALTMIRRSRRRLGATLVATLPGGASVERAITLKI